MPLRLGKGVPVCELEVVDEREEELVLVSKELAVPLKLGEGVLVYVPDGEVEAELVPDGEGVRDDDGVPVAEAELVAVVELEAVPVCEEEPVVVAELDGVLVELDGVVLMEEMGDGADEALLRLAMLRPRKVMDDTAASASPASHSVDS